MTKVILDVPHVKQLENYCVPACLTMVFRYFGHSVNQREVASFFEHDVKEGGVEKNSEILNCARSRGFIAYGKEKIGLDGIVQNIENGIPLIAVIKYDMERGVSHSVVVCGYEKKPSVVWFNDPIESRVKMSYEKFANLWRIRRVNDNSNQYGIIIHE